MINEIISRQLTAVNQTMRPWSLVAILFVALTAWSATEANAKKPNIVLIIADDLAWADVGFNGHKFHETPTLDRLARKGIILDQFYSGGPNCAPTRACLMSGTYTPRTRIYTPGARNKGNPRDMHLKTPGKTASGADTFESRDGNTDGLESSFVCIPEVLKPAGYRCGRFGKWHLGKDTQGFDHSTSSGKDGPNNKHYGSITVAESLTTAACDWIEDVHTQGPFFLYLSHWDVHEKVQTKESLKNKYLRKANNATGAVKRYSNRAGAGGVAKSAAYAGMVEQVDRSVKRVFAKLQELGIEENTLIVFTSDNGGAARSTSNRPLRGSKGALFEGGIRVSTFAYWKGVIEPGSVSKTPLTSVDFLPTLAELAGAELPRDQPVDGRSFLRLLKRGEQADLDQRAIFWHFPLYLEGKGEGMVIPKYGRKKRHWRGVPSSVIRKGKWKLIHFFETDTAALFDLADDPYEKDDLVRSAEHRATYDQLLTELRAWQKKTGAPIPVEINPKFEAPKESR